MYRETIMQLMATAVILSATLQYPKALVLATRRKAANIGDPD